MPAAFPPGMTLASVTVGPVLGSDGKPVVGQRIVLTPEWELIHAPSSSRLLRTDAVIVTGPDGTGSVTIPRSDTPGLTRPNPRYWVAWEQNRSADRLPEPGWLYANADVVDLEQAQPTSGSAGIAVQPTVSVAGLVGAITAAGLADALVEALAPHLSNPVDPLGAAGRVALVPRPTGGSNGQALVKNGDDVSWATVSGSGSIPSASAGTAGVLRLAGELGGTADAPTVPGKLPTIAMEAYGADSASADNAAAMQAALNFANSGLTRSTVSVTLSKPGTYLIADRLLIYPNTKLVLGPGVTIKKANGVTANVCMIRNANMQSTDRNIEITGGTWDGNQTNNQSTLVVSDKTNPLVGVGGDLNFIGVTGLYVHDVTITQCWGFGLQAIGSRMRFRNIDWGIAGTRRDGLHINGPSSMVDIDGVTGWTHDDFVALNAWDWTGSSPSVGDITDVTIRNLSYLNPGGTDVTGALVKFLPGTRGGTRGDVKRVTVQDVFGVVTGSPAFHFFTDVDPAGSVPSGAGVVSEVTIRGAHRLRIINGQPLIWLGQEVRGLSVDGIEWNENSVGAKVVAQQAGRTCDRIDVAGLYMAVGYDQLFDIKGTIGEFLLSRSRLIGLNDGSVSTGGDAAVFNINNGGSVARIVADRVNQKFGGSFVYIQGNAAATATEVVETACVHENVKHVYFNFKPLTVKAVGCRYTAIPNDIARVDGGSFTGSFRACEATYSGGVPFTRVNSAPIRVISSDLPVDASKTIISAYQAGDELLNSNAALACGAGRLVTDGTSWKNLYSGATY